MQNLTTTTFPQRMGVRCNVSKDELKRMEQSRLQSLKRKQVENDKKLEETYRKVARSSLLQLFYCAYSVHCVLVGLSLVALVV